MRTRILSALAGIPLVLAALFLAGPGFFGVLVLALGLFALHEYVRLCAVEPVLAWGTLAAGLGALALVPVAGAAGAAAAALLGLALLSLWRIADPARRFRGLGESAFGLAYIGLAMACLWRLRVLPGGAAWVFVVLAATWVGDSAAYFIGTRFGRHRLAPILSPKKTWEGAAAGLAGSVAGALVALPVLSPGVPPVRLAALGAGIGIAGQLGDLFESLWKRAKGVKDSGTIIPGHGGILDRIDSLLLAIPVAYAIVVRWAA